MSILLIMIYSKDKIYDKMLEIQRLYINKHRNIDAYFIAYDENQEEDVKLSDDIIYVKGTETYINILHKTIKSIDHIFNTLNKKYDFVVRSNISTIINLDNLYNYVGTLSPTNTYTGGYLFNLRWPLANFEVSEKNQEHKNDYYGLKFIKGNSIVISSDIIKHLLTIQDIIEYDIVDDVKIGILIKTYFSEVYNNIDNNVLAKASDKGFINDAVFMDNRENNTINLARNNVDGRIRDLFNMRHTVNQLYNTWKYKFIVICGSTERKKLMEEQFSALKSSVIVHYLEASTPSNSSDYLNDCGEPERDHGAVCCTKSHIRALEHASKSNSEFSIILEDDVAFLKENFLQKIEELVSNNEIYKDHKMVSIGWIPTKNYVMYSLGINCGQYYPGMQGYIVKNNDIPYLDHLVQSTYTKMKEKLLTSDRYIILKKHFGDIQNTVAADVLINRMLHQCAVFPPLMIERDIPSMLGHNNMLHYWDNFFKGYEAERDKYRLSTKKTTLVVVDTLAEYERKETEKQYEDFNNSTKIKFLFLRSHDEQPSWTTDTTKIWGPDVEAEYIVDILTNDGAMDNIHFLSVPSTFKVDLIKNVDIVAYGSNRYHINYIRPLVDILKPKVLFHLSDEQGIRTEYNDIFKKVQLVYRQYKCKNVSNDMSIKYLPVGYHSWGKKYIREPYSESIIRPYKWCFIGSPKNNRATQTSKLTSLSPHFLNNTRAFESTELYRKSTFAFCPPGDIDIENSRIYEALYNGCIPIILADKDNHDTEDFKRRFEIPMPCYFSNSIDEVYSIIQNTPPDEIIRVQKECLQWVNDIAEKIRNDVVNVISNNLKNVQLILSTKCKVTDIHLNKTPNINDLTVPLVVSYENDFYNNVNSQMFKKTMEKLNWEYIFIGEGDKWEGFKSKIVGYYNFLKTIPEEKMVILSDARDVFCLRSPLTIMNHLDKFTDMDKKIIISGEMFLCGHMDWTDQQIEVELKKDPTFFFQGIPMKKYWNYLNKTTDMPLRKYVNSGLIIGKNKNLTKALKWIIDNKYNDDQLGFSNYTNENPELVVLDYNVDLLHTSGHAICGGLYSPLQKNDSVTLSELFGQSSYFLHIPGISVSRGQKYMYNIISSLINSNIIKQENELSNLYATH